MSKTTSTAIRSPIYEHVYVDLERLSMLKLAPIHPPLLKPKRNMLISVHGPGPPWTWVTPLV